VINAVPPSWAPLDADAGLRPFGLDDVDAGLRSFGRRVDPRLRLLPSAGVRCVAAWSRSARLTWSRTMAALGELWNGQ
jgi:hypothetical protein